jgi:hypothetical protein
LTQCDGCAAGSVEPFEHFDQELHGVLDELNQPIARDGDFRSEERIA